MRKIVTWFGKTCAWLSFAIVLIICFDVVFRYAFRATQIWMIELEWHLFGILFIVCGAWCWLEDRHVRVDVIYGRMRQTIKNRIDLIGHMLLAIPWIVVVIYVTFIYAGYSFSWQENSPDPGGLPGRYFIKYILCFGFVLMAFAAISKILNFNQKTY